MKETDIVEKHRRHLPHYQRQQQIISLTWRLAFTLPQEMILLLGELRTALQEINTTREELSKESHAAYYAKLAKYDDYLDRFELPGLSLSSPDIASLLCSVMQFYDQGIYILHAYCVMPNHVHLLIQPIEISEGGFTKVSSIVQRVKTYSAKQINLLLNREGKIWSDEYFDRYIRNPQDYFNVVNYILNNPVKAGLVAKSGDWEYSYCKSRSM